MGRSPTAQTSSKLARALEDYLETIYLLSRNKGFARVRDIASARNVRPASVVPALKRLSEAGLVHYHQREYVELTPQGTTEARKVLSKHRALERFLHEFLLVPADKAEETACALEHSLSPLVMDRLAAFFEFLERAPAQTRPWLEQFHAWLRANRPRRRTAGSSPHAHRRGSKRLADLHEDAEAVVVGYCGREAQRQRLVDMGLLPGTRVKVEARGGPRKDWRVRLHGAVVTLDHVLASAVAVREG